MSTSTITKDGRPLGEYLDQVEGQEIDDVRSEATRMKVRQPIVSRTMRNHSGAKTTAATSYMPDPRATKVLTGGLLVDQLEKAPFTPSGFSGQGMQDINEPGGTAKCHHCGEFFESIAAHLVANKIDVAGYRFQHRLPRSLFSLMSPRLVKILRENGKKRASAGGPEVLQRNRGTAKAHASIRTNGNPGTVGYYTSKHNLASECRAQLTVRLLAMALELGRCPTLAERLNGNIKDCAIQYAFREMSVRRALRSIGLEPLAKGCKAPPMP